MQIKLYALISLFSFSAFACPKPWVCSTDSMDIPTTNLLGPTTVTAKIRSGQYPEKGQFKGNILYFEGLADSMVNHGPLFEKLSQAGYRILAFDYPGQGGSSGSMNDTRIRVIPQIGKLIWKKWANNKKSPVTIMGWSTGGLAAYMATEEYKVDRLVLIAPGIVPSLLVGEGLSQWPLNHITLPTLTSDRYGSSNVNPHLDPIMPDSPLDVPAFSKDLISKSFHARRMTMNRSVKGLVLLGTDDSYVNANRIAGVIQRNAPHFKVRMYQGARHEIDNEKASIRNQAHADILSFLK